MLQLNTSEESLGHFSGKTNGVTSAEGHRERASNIILPFSVPFIQWGEGCLNMTGFLYPVEIEVQL